VNPDVDNSKSEINNKKKKINYRLRARLVDTISKIAFPVAYIIFNIIFWSAYSSK
jgi:hypothetical protein